jgi:predicted MPP superfamily phosphohydrolase
MRFTVIFPLIILFLFLRGVYPLFRGPLRWILCPVFIVLAMVPTALRFTHGPMVAPVLPESWLVWANTLQMLVLGMALITGLRDISAIVLHLCGRHTGSWARSRKGAAASLALVTALTAYGTWNGMKLPVVDEREIAIENLPAELEGLRIAQISDIHASALLRAERTAEIVRRTMAARPDMVLITGDFVDGQVADRAVDLAPLKKLSAPLGVWGCEGNHEHYVDYPGWRAFLPTLGVGMLYNMHAVVMRGDTPIVIAGTTDFNAVKFPGRELPDVDKALEGAPRAFTILMIHQPIKARGIAAKPIDLMLSGHTHGGQTPLVMMIAKILNKGLLEGLYRIEPDPSVPQRTAFTRRRAMPAFVQTGTQFWNGYPLRIGTRNEITILRLTRQKQ